MKPEGEGEEIGEENDQSGEKKCFWIFVAPIRTKLVLFWLPNSSFLFVLLSFPYSFPKSSSSSSIRWVTVNVDRMSEELFFWRRKKRNERKKGKGSSSLANKEKRSTARVSSYRVTLYERSVCQAFQILLLDILYVRERERERERGCLRETGL